MRIQQLKVDNFKSLVEFELDLAKFTCLIGLNGAGKSTVLQFIDFLSQLVRGDIKEWLNERSWESKDIKSQLVRKNNIEFTVQLIDGAGQAAEWRASFNPTQSRCTSEEIRVAGASLHVESRKYFLEGPDSFKIEGIPISFNYEGSILSQLIEKELPESLLTFKNYIKNIVSLDLLSPEYLRQRTRGSSDSLGLGGQRLSSYLHEMGPSNRHWVVERLKEAYPQLQELHARSQRYGWKKLEISEEYRGADSGLIPSMTTEARHINDGMLRLIAILAELRSEHAFILFDEIENGINPELVEFVLNALTSARQQVMVTTHSPMILNYLDDDVAREGVIYLYRTPEGKTQSIPFFSIPSLAKKLEVMGPGEAFVDTRLAELGEEIEDVRKGS